LCNQMEKEKETVPKENGQNKQAKPKKGKIEHVWELSQNGKKVKEIAKKTGLKEQIVRSYIWRKKFPEKYKALLDRYYANKKKKKTQNNQTIPEKAQ